MRPFAYQRAESAERAIALAAAARAHFLAGGTTLIDLMKTGAMAPGTLIDINDLARSHGRIEAGPEGLRLGALVRMADAAANPDIRRDYPVIAESLDLAASQQLRRMASLGGTCCSAPAAATSAIRAGARATSASPAAAAPPSAGSTGCMRCWASVTAASPAIPAISARRWRRWTPRSDRRAQGAAGDRLRGPAQAAR